MAVVACNRPAPASAPPEVTDGSAQDSALPDANPAATVPSPTDEASPVGFVAAAGMNNLFEVNSGMIALKRSKTPEVKAFAQMMVDTHIHTAAELKAAIKEAGLAIKPPIALTGRPQDEVDGLLRVDIKGFDKKYMDAEVSGHQDALNLMTRYARDGDLPALKAFAVKAAPAAQDNLTHAKAIRDALK